MLALQTIEDLFGDEDRTVPRGAVTDRRQEFGELAQSGDRPVCRQPIDEAMRADIVECRHSSAISVSAYCACALAGVSS